MTKAAFEAIINAHENKEKHIIVVYCDNDGAEFYVPNLSNSDRYFDITNIVTMGDADFMKLPVLLSNNKTGKRDIPATNYIPMDRVQGVLCIDNIEDIERLDRTILFTS